MSISLVFNQLLRYFKITIQAIFVTIFKIPSANIFHVSILYQHIIQYRSPQVLPKSFLFYSWYTLQQFLGTVPWEYIHTKAIVLFLRHRWTLLVDFVLRDVSFSYYCTVSIFIVYWYFFAHKMPFNVLIPLLFCVLHSLMVASALLPCVIFIRINYNVCILLHIVHCLKWNPIDAQQWTHSVFCFLSLL